MHNSPQVAQDNGSEINSFDQTTSAIYYGDITNTNLIFKDKEKP
jgi:hypothetical protein